MISLLQFAAFVFALAYQFSFFWMLHTFIPLRKGVLIRLLAFALSRHLAGVVVYRHDLDNILLSFFGLILYLILFHQGKMMEKMAAAFIFYPVMVSVNFLMMDASSQIFFAMADAPDLHEMWTDAIRLADASIYAAACFARLLFWCGVSLLLKKPLQHIRLNLTAGMWLIVDSLMAVPGIGCFTVIYFNIGESFAIYPLCIAAIFSSLGCVCLVAYLGDAMQAACQLERLRMQQGYYQGKLKEEERIRSIYHDMKNHLLVLEKSQGREATKQMARELRAQIAEYEDYTRTGNEFLDIILKDKAEKARGQHVDFSAVVDFHGISFIEPLDLSTFFGNGLDNAMEALEKLPEGQRAILLKAGRVQDFVSIRIENPCVPGEGAGNRRTSKADGFLHGFGISNMRKAAEKYGGQLVAKQEKERFVLKILIPVPKGKGLACSG